jgi:hypothetical protein
MTAVVKLSIAVTFCILSDRSVFAAGDDHRVFDPVPNVPGAYQLRGGSGPLTAAPHLRVDGVDVLGMDYAHLSGRREPLRLEDADLSDWKTAPAGRPDRILIDRKAGRLRFFPGTHLEHFKDDVVARFRGTHGDNAILQWKDKDHFYLSSWESAYHVWSYDVSDPSSPKKISEVGTENYAHGFVLAGNGYGLQGTSGKKVFLLDLRNPNEVKVLNSDIAQGEWLFPLNARYVSISGPKNRLVDTASLPEKLVDITPEIPSAVHSCLGRRIETLSEERVWCVSADSTKLALVSLKGAPSSWSIERSVSLPQGSQDEFIRPLGPEKFVLMGHSPDGKSRWLQVLDVRGGSAQLLPRIDVSPRSRSLNVVGGKAVYLATLPEGANEGASGTYDGMCFTVYDLSDPSKIARVGEWDPAQPNKVNAIFFHPERPTVGIVLDRELGFGLYICDFSDPLRPKLLCEQANSFEGNRVAAWGDRALFTSTTLAQWFDCSNPRQPKVLGSWFNHRWFHVRHVFGDYALVKSSAGTETVDFRDPKNPKVVARWPGSDSGTAAWGSRIYGVGRGNWSGDTPLSIIDISDPLHPKDLKCSFLVPEPVGGAWADGPLLYVVTQGERNKAILLILDVSDPAHVRELSRFRHPELEVARGEWFFTAQGRVLTAAHGIVVITSYGSGPPQVIDARDPKNPKFLMRLAKGGNEWCDSYPDGPWFHVNNYYGASVQIWDFSRPEAPRMLWEEKGTGGYDAYAWQGGQPIGEMLLAPKLPYLKVMSVPRPSQLPTGILTWNP